MARPKQDSISVATTERLLTAAAEAFALDGFRGARLGDIASAAGVRRPSLLYHYPSKVALYQAVVDQAFVALADAIGRVASTPGTYGQRLQAITAALISFERQRPHLGRLILRALLDRNTRDDAVPTERTVSMAERLSPIIDRLEAFVTSDGPPRLPDAVPVRAAVSTLLVGHLTRASLGPDAVLLFGAADPTPALTRALLNPSDTDTPR